MKKLHALGEHDPNNKLISYWYKDKIGSFMGDSLTAVGSGGLYLNYIKDYFSISKIENCGIGGTRVSGQAENAFWTDNRVNTLNILSRFIGIMGGTNDCPYTTVEELDFTRENHNTNNFVGAYNVLISKIYYKYLKLETGYYDDIDYSHITQVETALDFIPIILITPPKRFDSEINTKFSEQFANYVKRICAMWGLPVVDANSNMQMNFMTYPSDREDKVHFPVEFHKKLAEVIIGKLKSIEPYEF